VADTPAEDETTASENLLMALSVPEILMPSFGALTSKGYIECAVPLSVLCTAVGTVCPLFAPLSSGDDWWPDYLADADIRQRYFKTGTSELKDPTLVQRRRDRLWIDKKILVPANRWMQAVGQCHDLPHCNHWGAGVRVVCFR